MKDIPEEFARVVPGATIPPTGSTAKTAIGDAPATHTPGPWTARPRRTGDSWWVEAPIEGGRLGYLAECVGRNASEANALLVAAAPDLLQALRDVLEMIDHEIPVSVGSLGKARAAIAKAEGR